MVTSRYSAAEPRHYADAPALVPNPRARNADTTLCPAALGRGAVADTAPPLGLAYF